jgi:hypothetical protein
MSLRIDPLPAATGVAASQDSLFQIPAGRDVHVVWLQISEATNNVSLVSGNLVGDIQCILNDKPFRQVTGVQLNHINACNDAQCAVKTTQALGQPGYQTLLPIFFAEPWRKVPASTHGSALHTYGTSGLQIKVRLGNLTNPVITGWYEWEPATTPLTLLTKWVRKTYQAVGAINEDNNVPRGDLFQAMHFFPTTDGKFVYQLDLKTDGYYRRKELTYLQNQATLIARGLNPDVGNLPVYDVIFDYDDPMDQWLVTSAISSFEFKASLNAAAVGNQDVVSVRVGNL